MTPPQDSFIFRSVMNDWQHTNAFVIQFRSGINVGTGQFAGRIEHVASCKTTQFHSLDEFTAFVAQVLEQVRIHQEESS
jgi:hypothetical protein